MERDGPTPRSQIKIRRHILAVEILPEEQGVSAPHEAPKPRVPVLGREVFVTSGCEKQQELRLRQRALESQAVPLKGPTQGLTLINFL